MNMQEHLFVGHDGALYDTRNPNWSKNAPLRPRYSIHSRRVLDTRDFKASLRAGAFTFPGCYELVFLTTDGGALCFDCARDNASNIFWSIKNDVDDGWRVSGLFNTADSDCGAICDHCGRD